MNGSGLKSTSMEMNNFQMSKEKSDLTGALYFLSSQILHTKGRGHKTVIYLPG